MRRFTGHTLLSLAVPFLSLFALFPRDLQAQSIPISLDASRWVATDSLRVEPWHGKQAIWINKGVALAQGVNFRNGTLDLEIMFDSASNNAGIAFHGRDAKAFEAIFFRPGSSGSNEAIQYAPGLNSVAVAWQIYHGDGATAVATLHRNAWMHVAIKLHGDSADLFLDHATEPVLTVPHLALGADAGGEVGVWTGGFGAGLHVADMTFTPDNTPHVESTLPLPHGTIMDWELSPSFDASTQTPGKLPLLTTMKWQSVHAEYPGFVLINRYRASPNTFAPVKYVDSVIAGRVKGSSVVYLRTTINADKAGARRMHIAFSDNALVYCNGVPLYFGVRPSYLNDELGYLNMDGESVYLPLHAGKNEIVVAVTEFFGGWVFGGRLD